jgi:hypothetical protein
VVQQIAPLASHPDPSVPPPTPSKLPQSNSGSAPPGPSPSIATSSPRTVTASAFRRPFRVPGIGGSSNNPANDTGSREPLQGRRTQALHLA